MLGGWLDFTLMYNGLLSGLSYGSYLPVDRFSVKSRKLTTLIFASLTMLRLNYGFLEDVSIALINKTDGSDPTERETFWMHTLKTLAPYGLNVEDSI